MAALVWHKTACIREIGDRKDEMIKVLPHGYINRISAQKLGLTARQKAQTTHPASA